MPGPDDRAGEAAGAQHLRCRRGRWPGSWRSGARRAAAGCRRTSRWLSAFSMSLRARSEVGALAERARDRRVDVERARRRPAASRSARSCTFQMLAVASGRRSAARRRSSACFTAVSAMISCSWLAATSACADTRSSGGDCADVDLGLVDARQLLRRARAPTAARRRWRAPTRDSSTRVFTSAVVWTRLSRSRVSAMSRLVRLVASCCRGAVDRQVAEQRLRHVERQARLQQRVVAVQEAVAVGVRRRSTPTL